MPNEPFLLNLKKEFKLKCQNSMNNSFSIFKQGKEKTSSYLETDIYWYSEAFVSKLRLIYFCEFQ